MKCPNCDAYMPNDELIDFGVIDGNTFTTVQVVCPVCGKKYMWRNIFSYQDSCDFHEI